MIELQVNLTLEIEGEEKVVALSKSDAERLLSELQSAIGSPTPAIYPVPMPYVWPYSPSRPYWGIYPLTCGTTSINCTAAPLTATLKSIEVR